MDKLSQTSDPSTVAQITAIFDKYAGHPDATPAPIYQSIRACKSEVLSALSHPSVPNGRSAGEAVAWRYCNKLTGIFTYFTERLTVSYAEENYDEVPLYATPPATDGMQLVQRSDLSRYALWLETASEYGIISEVDGTRTAFARGCRDDAQKIRAMLAAQPNESKGG